MCPNAKAMSLIVNDVVIKDDIEPPQIYDEDPRYQNNERDDDIKGEEQPITLTTLNEQMHPWALKFEGLIARQPVTILVDSGVSLNFISANLVVYLQLTGIRGQAPFDITLGNGQKISCHMWLRESL